MNIIILIKIYAITIKINNITIINKIVNKLSDKNKDLLSTIYIRSVFNWKFPKITWSFFQGCINFTKWYNWNMSIFKISAISGRLDIIEYLLSEYDIHSIAKGMFAFYMVYDVTYSNYFQHVFLDASMNGHLHVLKYLISLPLLGFNEWIYIESFKKAALDGHFHIIKYLMSLDYFYNMDQVTKNKFITCINPTARQYYYKLLNDYTFT